MEETIQTELLVIGAGPGGYTAAFYAAAHGKRVTLVEQDQRLGGVCLNRGCIPSKALLHAAKLIQESRHAGDWGIEFGEPKIHLEKMRTSKESILEKLGQGIANLAGRRGVQVIQGRAMFENAKTVSVDTAQGPQKIPFQNAIIATGSRAALPRMFDIKDPRVMTSTEALALQDIPKRLLVIGGGYIGMELGTVYAALGSEVVVAEALSGILTGADVDLVRLVQERAASCFKEIRLNVNVLGLTPKTDGIEVKIKTSDGEKNETYDRVLVSVGRVPQSDKLGLEKAGIQVNEKGFIRVDGQQKTSAKDIYAIGDVAGGVLLAHKASHEAKKAVDAILSETPASLAPAMIPAVVFTDPEIAWVGLTETDAKTQNRKVQIVKFPWSASGRALTMGRTDGVTKLLIDPETEKILGAGICGAGAGELISEASVAISCGMKAKDLENLIHPHPTLSETLAECAGMFYGHAIHAYSRKRS